MKKMISTMLVLASMTIVKQLNQQYEQTLAAWLKMGGIDVEYDKWEL
jgi:hypothetical protein